MMAALDLGLKILFPMTHMYPNYVCCRETAYGKSLRDKRELFVKFHQAQIRAYRDFHENKEEAIAILVKESSQDRSYIQKNGIEAADIVDRTVYRDALDNIIARYPDVGLCKDLERGCKANNIDI
jgi:hypothetical protein